MADCETLKARLRLLEKYAKNLILDDPEGNYEIGWNAAVRDILSEIEYWKDGILQDEPLKETPPQRGIISELSRKTKRLPQRSIRQDSGPKRRTRSTLSWFR